MTLHALLPPDPMTKHSHRIQLDNNQNLHGSAEFFARDLRAAAGNDEWIQLVAAVTSDKKTLAKLEGEWLLSARQGEITATYTPFSYKVMTDRYARYIDESGMEGERYKWVRIEEFQTAWRKYEAGELDFTGFFSGLQFDNLVHYFSSSAWKTVLNTDAPRFEAAMLALYNEEDLLEKRIVTFSEEIQRMHAVATGDPKKSTGQDERAIGLLLAFRYPDRYALFKDDFYQTLAKCLKVAPRPKWKKYLHYMELVNDIKSKHINQLLALTTHTESIAADERCYNDPEHLLLIQNILYRTLEVRAELKRTVDADPKRNDDAELFKNAIDGIAKNDLNHYLTLAAKTLVDFGISADDERLSFSVAADANRIAVILGNRIINGIRQKQNASHVLFIGDQLENTVEQDTFTNGSKTVAWLNYFDSPTAWTAHWTTYSAHVSTEVERGVPNIYRSTSNRHFQTLIEQRMAELNTQPHAVAEPVQALNQIFFGPPGTGKTYFLSSQYFTRYTTTQSNISKQEYLEEVVAQLTWWQVVAIALRKLGPSKVQTILEHPWVQVKARQSNSKNVRATLWNSLQMHTPLTSSTVSLKQRQMPYLFDKGSGSQWELLEDEYLNNAAELETLLNDVENFKAKPDQSIRRYVFTTFHQSFTYEDFIEGLKPDLDDEGGELKYIIEDGVFKALCKRAEADPDNRYAIFIDEINRGNIAAIFGELISLIEADKRKGAKNELYATLPYSKQRFAVPSNIDVYGTMNTADRSVEALDTALRRRFSFVEMPPRPDLIASAGQAKNQNGMVMDVHLPTLLTRVNARIEHLLNRDHLIGHAYFMQVGSIEGLKAVFRDKIIPLLQEYFFGDFGKIGLVLGAGFVRKKSSSNASIFAQFNDYDHADLADRVVYELISIDAMSDGDFIAALRLGGLVGGDDSVTNQEG